MEVSVKKNDFAQVLRLVQSVTERKATIPALGAFLLTADANGLAITGTDLELAGMCHCPATVKQPGSLVVPARRLTEYVKMLPEVDLYLKEQASHWLALSCGQSRSRIACSTVDSYPELPKPPQEGVTISCGVLARLAEKVIFAIATEQNSINLTGALLKLEPTGPTMVPTMGIVSRWSPRSSKFPAWRTLSRSSSPRKP